ncbi:Transposase IS4 [Popillia japonica]|uniref:Transposase IS4 n=1 Tax=Popillia japonica TaxID=7064 RepID=A0AAW1KGT7_POPJA
MYTGATQPDPGLPDVGASGNIVLKLAKIIPQNMFYKIYYDNWFNSIYLQVALEKRGIQSIGTIRPNRLQGCNFISDKEMSRKGQGTFAAQRTTLDGVKLICVKWFDNTTVHTLSTFAGAHPVKNVKRWNSKTKSRIDVPCPSSTGLITSKEKEVKCTCLIHSPITLT